MVWLEGDKIAALRGTDVPGQGSQSTGGLAQPTEEREFLPAYLWGGVGSAASGPAPSSLRSSR